jgi:hypothetical protein
MFFFIVGIKRETDILWIGLFMLEVPTITVMMEQVVCILPCYATTVI